MAEQKQIVTFKVYNKSIHKEMDVTYEIEFNDCSGKYKLYRVTEFSINGRGSYQTILKAFHFAWDLTCFQFGKENIIDWDCE